MRKNKHKIITLIFILVTISLIVFIYAKNSHYVSPKTAKCIASKSTLYILTGCSACKIQEDLFGKNLKYINMVDCAVEPQKCGNIQIVPTWIINKEKRTGVQSIEKLKELTGC